MKWKGRRGSTNVEDARGRRVAAGAGGLGMILNLVGRTFGIKGILVLVVLGFIGWQMGLLDPAALMGGGQVQETAYQPSPEEQERFEFVRVVLADTEDVWAREFERIGRQYVEPGLVIYSGQYPTACGMGDARMGPFYCPADRKIYIDLTFYDELARAFDAPGDFAQAYVIAHEVGHHVQNLLGISEQVAALRGRPEYNQNSVRLELQADYLAGVWAHHNHQYLEHGDIEEAMRAANQIGDDAIQQRTQGRIAPHAFTHGSSEQRMRWFKRGLESGRVEEGDTFEPAYERL
ncbi:neutral zinc metallopeptidase [Thioalkalivibrio sp. XN279]|uniref:KPN_02809 family neutral zinc metallopeptidase n=1 Tax=Thioalkalivibrio sp. XN279 TaxID=2714953 RepID=UPI0014094225|nr:neutral zinc metallopeptidase [Thioalkalivibrio sp. XN279]NHA13948.1 metalloprotease [Thioalkalivibrio sp. XN279]